MSINKLQTALTIFVLAYYAKAEYLQVVQSETLYQKVETNQGRNGSNFSKTTIVQSISQCAVLCRNHAECHAFTFENASLCRLIRIGQNSTPNYFEICSRLNPCQNGGTCIRQNSPQQVLCICPIQYHGRFCEYENSIDNSTTETYETTSEPIYDTTTPPPSTYYTTNTPTSTPNPTTAVPLTDYQYFYAQQGTILSPNYPQNYLNGMNYYYFVMTTGSLINFHVNTIQVESEPPNCPYDYVKIYDGLTNTSRLLSTLCGNGPFNDINTTGPSATLHFHTDASITRSGFNITFLAEQ